MDKTIALEKIQKYMDKIRGGGKTEIYKKKLDYYMNKVLYGGNDENINIENMLMKQFSSDEYFMKNKDDIITMCTYLYNSMSKFGNYIFDAKEKLNDDTIDDNKLEENIKKYIKYVIELQNQISKKFLIDFNIISNDNDFNFNIFTNRENLNKINKVFEQNSKEDMVEMLEIIFQNDKDYQQNKVEIKSSLLKGLYLLHMYILMSTLTPPFSKEKITHLEHIMKNKNGIKYIEFIAMLLQQKFLQADIVINYSTFDLSFNF